jgi:hypothetical protein
VFCVLCKTGANGQNLLFEQLLPKRCITPVKFSLQAVLVGFQFGELRGIGIQGYFVNTMLTGI